MSELLNEAGYDLAIVGAGFCGRMLLAQLASQGAASAGMRIVLLDPQLDAGVGRAYHDPARLLSVNVPAGNLSAWPQRPEDFVMWWAQACNRPAADLAAAFAARADYGDYLRDTCRQAMARGGLECEERVAAVRQLERCGRHWQLHLADGGALVARVVVLATGNPRPATPAGLAPGDPRLLDPLQPGALARMDRSARVLILGSGLSAIDALQQLMQRRHCGPVSLLSRHGLLPAAHAESPGARLDWSALPLGGTARSSFRAVRRELARAQREGRDWRGVIDGLRPHTVSLWQNWSLAERARFLRHLRALWEVHRHRAAGPVHGQIMEAIAAHPVQRLAGRLQRVDPDGSELQVHWLPRGAPASSTLACDVLLNTSAPAVLDNSLLQQLLSAGVVQSDPLQLGLALAVDGQAARDLYALGPLARGRDWESTAIPELRLQASALASHLLKVLAA